MSESEKYPNELKELRKANIFAADTICELTARAEKAEADYQFMVDRAADEHLDGYRELGAKCAALEERAEKAEARVKELEGELERRKKYLDNCERNYKDLEHDMALHGDTIYELLTERDTIQSKVAELEDALQQSERSTKLSDDERDEFEFQNTKLTDEIKRIDELIIAYQEHPDKPTEIYDIFWAVRNLARHIANKALTQDTQDKPPETKQQKYTDGSYSREIVDKPVCSDPECSNGFIYDYGCNKDGTLARRKIPCPKCQERDE